MHIFDGIPTESKRTAMNSIVVFAVYAPGTLAPTGCTFLPPIAVVAAMSSSIVGTELAHGVAKKSTLSLVYGDFFSKKYVYVVVLRI